MADMKKNALAELAKWLECDIRMIEFGNVAQLKRFRKVKRIVAELAKVVDGSWVKGDAGWFYVCRAESRVVETAVGKCRAIAEEVAGNDK